MNIIKDMITHENKINNILGSNSEVQIFPVFREIMNLCGCLWPMHNAYVINDTAAI